jgi:hypothetical protein
MSALSFAVNQNKYPSGKRSNGQGKDKDFIHSTDFSCPYLSR